MSCYRPRQLSIVALIGAVLSSMVLSCDLYAYRDFGNFSVLDSIVLAFHQLPLILGVLFNWFGVYKHSHGYLMTAAILYTVSVLPLYQYYYIFGIPMLFAFIGYANQRTLNQRFAEFLNSSAPDNQ